MQAWEKHGLIYGSDRAQVPVVLEMGPIWRIYFSSRDSQGRSFPRFIDVEAGNPKKILREHKKPLLDVGPPGSFDASGVMPTWAVRVEDEIYLYYIGWTQRVDIPYHNSIGLAVSQDGEAFTKAFPGPIFSPTPLEPYFTGTLGILREGAQWTGYYLSTVEWVSVDGRQEPRYDIKVARSADGVTWQRDGKTAIPLTEDEGGIVKACVLKDTIYRMWYSFRKTKDYRTNKSQSYRIGYATSFNGVDWVRQDDSVRLHPEESGWDSQMLCYPHVVRHEDLLYMFYNGNGFGATGIGFATLGPQ